MKTKRNCIIYGAGRWGRMAHEEFAAKRKILFYVDANENLHGKQINGLPVKSITALRDFVDTEIIIAVAHGSAEIKATLFAMGVKNVKRYWPGSASLPDEALPEERRTSPAILTEVTIHSTDNIIIGITRVIHKIMTEFCHIENVLPVRIADDKLVTNYTFLQKFIITTSFESEQIIKFINGDILFFLDEDWYRDPQETITYAKNAEVPIYTLIYDLYPTYNNHINHDNSRGNVLSSFQYTLANSSALICYSHSVAEETATYLEQQNLPISKDIPIYVFPLGADILHKEYRTENIRPVLRRFLESEKVFLMVGTVCEHKGYAAAIDAFQQLPKEYDAKLLIVGNDSSKDEALKQKIDNCVGENLLWLKDADDEELRYCYQNATALIAASYFEGYGLPLIEAAQFGLPIICSDIPIFHEVTQEHALFFEVSNADALSKAITFHLNGGQIPSSKNIKLHTWKESATALMDILEGKTEPYVIFKGQK